jgi:hypothetical protein
MTRSDWTRLAALLLALIAPACGSDPVTQPPVVVATPTPCTQTNVFQGAGSFPPNVLDAEHISTTTTGRLDVTLDWTFTSSTIGLYVVAAGSCDLDAFKRNACNFLMRAEGTAKPRKGSVANLAPGNYDVLIAYVGSQQESMSIQVILSSSSCPAITRAQTVGAPDGAGQPRTQDRGLLQR